ncbi:MAG: hypothetical protein ACOYN0_01910, partial [Phycisphaerales bacterium]
MKPATWFVALLLTAGLAPIGGCIELVAAQPEAPAPRGPRLSEAFTLHWMITTDDQEVKRGFNWSERFDFGGV